MTAQNPLEDLVSLLRATLDATHDGILVTDTAGTVLESNEQFSRLWNLPAALRGVTRHQAILDHKATLFDDPPAFFGRIEELYASSAPQIDVLRLRDGRVIERLAKPLFLPGRPTIRLWNYRDITLPSKAAELNSRLAAIVESADDAIISKNMQGIITSWNQAAERIFGYQASEAIGSSIAIIIPEDRIHEEEDILARIKRGERINRYETERIRKGGKRILVSLTISPIRDATGAIVGASKIAHDVTAQKRADEMRGRLAAIVESSEDAIVSKTLEGIITSWNRGAQRILVMQAELRQWQVNFSPFL